MADTSLGDAIRRLRSAAGFTQKELASRIEVDASYLCHLEAGRREPSLALLRRITSELSVPVGLLLGIVLAVEVPEEHRDLYDGVISQLLEAASAAQLSLPLAEISPSVERMSA